MEPTVSRLVVTASPETKNAKRLALVRGVHTFIYIVMAASTLLLVYAGLTGAQGWWLWVALGLLAVETVVLAGNGMNCPSTALAVSYRAETTPPLTPSCPSEPRGTRFGSSAR
jgi:hypothetical protein